MNILIFSDSHGDTAGIRSMIRRQVRTPDAIFFLGDGLRDTDTLSPNDPPFYPVVGNCDWFSADEAPTKIVMALGGHIVFATHGHLYRAKETEQFLLAHAAEVGADIILFGHTHTPMHKIVPAGTSFATLSKGTVTIDRDIHLFNPGSLRAGSFGSLTMQAGNLLFSHGEL